MLTEIRIGGLKSYGAEQALPLSRLTVLIGANASGKSNAIEAVQLLRWLAGAHRLGDLAHAMREGELPLRGRPVELARDGRSLALGCRTGELSLDLRLRVDPPGPRVAQERLRDVDGTTKVPYYEVRRAASRHGSELTTRLAGSG